MDGEQRPAGRQGEATAANATSYNQEVTSGAMIHGYAGAATLGPGGIRPVSGQANSYTANLYSHMGGAAFPEAAKKKKRGRPRKYGPDSRLALSVSPNTPGSATAAPAVSCPFSPNSEKRGRGRPPGSGKNQQLAALGELMLGSIGVGFTPHAITIAAGEDIASRIMSFSQQGPRGVCILSANGAISNVTLRQTSISGGAVTYEGRFEILSLSGSFLVTECGDGTRSRTGGLSVSLAGPDGRVIGGSVAGGLIAATPVQIVVGSFLNTLKKLQPKPSKLQPSPSFIPRPLTDLSKAFSVDGDKSMNDRETCGPSLHHGVDGAISTNSDSSKEYNVD